MLSWADFSMQSMTAASAHASRKLVPLLQFQICTLQKEQLAIEKCMRRSKDAQQKPFALRVNKGTMLNLHPSFFVALPGVSDGRSNFGMTNVPLPCTNNNYNMIVLYNNSAKNYKCLTL